MAQEQVGEGFGEGYPVLQSVVSPAAADALVGPAKVGNGLDLFPNLDQLGPPLMCDGIPGQLFAFLHLARNSSLGITRLLFYSIQGLTSSVIQATTWMSHPQMEQADIRGRHLGKFCLGSLSCSIACLSHVLREVHTGISSWESPLPEEQPRSRLRRRRADNVQQARQRCSLHPHSPSA